jgi:hypothetical protein
LIRVWDSVMGPSYAGGPTIPVDRPDEAERMGLSCRDEAVALRVVTIR